MEALGMYGSCSVGKQRVSLFPLTAETGCTVLTYLSEMMEVCRRVHFFIALLLCLCINKEVNVI